jgi:hypothetical protein
MIPGAAYLPSLPQISKETLAVLAATLIAAYLISRFPALSTFVSTNSVTVRTLPP